MKPAEAATAAAASGDSFRRQLLLAAAWTIRPLTCVTQDAFFLESIHISVGFEGRRRTRPTRCSIKSKTKATFHQKGARGRPDGDVCVLKEQLKYEHNHSVEDFLLATKNKCCVCVQALLGWSSGFSQFPQQWTGANGSMLELTDDEMPR